MSRPQNSPRGLFSKQQVETDKIVIGPRTIQANSTGFIFQAQAAKPTTRTAAKVTLLTNSTGQNAVLVNTTGTTWKYLSVTSVLPT